jgi:general secretion pathway protein A
MKNNRQLPQYLDCFGFVRAPFRLSPDPEFFFPSEGHYSARSVLDYTIQGGEGFMALIGEAGTGKTLLLRMLLKNLGEEKIAALILCPSLSPAGLMQLLLSEIGVSAPKSAEAAQLYTLFEQKLLELAHAGHELLIVVDEAQNLPIETMEQLRMLSNIELSSRKLLQILLVGQPALEMLLRDPKLGQLTQRIVVYEHLEPFTLEESLEYVRHRLVKAGREDFGLSKTAGRALFDGTHGIPRLINRLMDRALLFAGADQADRIEISHIRQAGETLPGDILQRPSNAYRRIQGSFFRTWKALVMAAVMSIFIYMNFYDIAGIL